MATCSSALMHEKANEVKAEQSLPQQLKDAQNKTREYRQWIAVSIGQFRYTQWLLKERAHCESEQIEEFVKKLEGVLKG